MVRVVAVVPARMASSRFPNKPLVPILDLPMVEHVRRRAALVDEVAEVVVATCDEAIADVVRASGGSVAMTADTHERCTERVEEAARSLSADVVVIVQGDEPLVLPAAVRAAIEPLLADEGVRCTNVLSPIESGEQLRDPDVVKAVLDRRGDIMYLTRAPVPHLREDGTAVGAVVHRQTGLIAMRTDLLRTFVTLPATPLERLESIDMLRLLEHGYRIRGVPLPFLAIGVDRPRDVPLVEEVLRSDPAQSTLYRSTLGA